MSSIQKQPFIEKVLATLSEEQLNALKGLINGSDQTPDFKSLINATYKITVSDKGVSHIVLETDLGKTSGYLVYNDDYCVFIGYQDIQELSMLEINVANQTYKLVKEPLTITELRFELGGNAGETSKKIEVNNITSLTDEQINGLNAGDLVEKNTSDQLHTYVVSYKENGTGICLTYTDASVVETVSYDYTGGHWVYNSTDITHLGEDKTIEVVELTGLSGTLSDSDYALVQQDNCVLKLGTQTFYKESSASTLITYQAFSRQAGQDQALYEYIEITKADKSWQLKNENIVEGNPSVPEGTTQTDLTGLKIGNTYYALSSGGSAPDSDVTVEIENDYTSTNFQNRTNYATAISLQDFIANCEAGNVYTNAGIIAKVNNLISGKAFRLLLIGTNHEVLAFDDTTQAKTTWQFLDMPEHNVRLGLPFNLLDWTSGSGRTYLNQYLDGTNTGSMDLYPSNMDGLISAQGLLQANMTIYEELPETLKRHIKTVRRYYYRKRNYMSVGASTEGNPGAESNSGQMCQLAQNVFHLAGTDLSTSGQSGEGSGSVYSYFNSSGSAKRIRYYNGTAIGWWNSSPSSSVASSWFCISGDGFSYDISTYNGFGVAPAFCI